MVQSTAPIKSINMTIKEYVKEYTIGKPVTLSDVFLEIREFIIELIALRGNAMKEEFQDVLHFLQLWLYWRIGINGELWKITNGSVQKFMDRKCIWNKIYTYVELPQNISGYAGNYNRLEKVINHLKKFGIGEEKAKEAYRKIVLTK